MLRAALAVALAAAVTALPAGQEISQANDPKTGAAVARASKYVDSYRKEFSAIVCEERQIQTLFKPDGQVRKRRVLVSDLMFLKSGDNPVPSGFRDVISVDGKPVRDRNDRLRKLFLDKPSASAVDKAWAIAIESGRYDLGVKRIGESPLLPIGLLGSDSVSNFRFTLTDRTLAFDELKSPTYMRAMRPGGLVYSPSRGSFVVDPETGAVLSVTLTSEGPADDMSRTFEARFDEHATLKMRVPVEMTETYRFPARPKDDRFEAKYTYSAFRRFQVTTSEIIK